MTQSTISLFFCLFLLSINTSQVLADGPPVPAGTELTSGAGTAGADGAAPQAPGTFQMLMPFILMFGVVYFLMIRPQQKKAKEHQNVLKGLNHGDEVVTSSGLLGKVTGITEKVITLEVADNVRVKMLKSQVSQIVHGQVKDLA